MDRKGRMQKLHGSGALDMVRRTKEATHEPSPAGRDEFHLVPFFFVGESKIKAKRNSPLSGQTTDVLHRHR